MVTFIPNLKLDRNLYHYVKNKELNLLLKLDKRILDMEYKNGKGSQLEASLRVRKSLGDLTNTEPQYYRNEDLKKMFGQSNNTF